MNLLPTFFSELPIDVAFRRLGDSARYVKVASDHAREEESPEFERTRPAVRVHPFTLVQPIHTLEEMFKE